MGRKRHEDASGWGELAPAPARKDKAGAAKTENGRTKSGRKNGPEAAAKRREQRRRRRIRQRDAGKVSRPGGRGCCSFWRGHGGRRWRRSAHTRPQLAATKSDRCLALTQTCFGCREIGHSVSSAVKLPNKATATP